MVNAFEKLTAKCDEENVKSTYTKLVDIMAIKHIHRQRHTHNVLPNRLASRNLTLDGFDVSSNIGETHVVESHDLVRIAQDVEVIREIATWSDRGDEKAVLVAIDLNGFEDHNLAVDFAKLIFFSK